MYIYKMQILCYPGIWYMETIQTDGVTKIDNADNGVFNQ